MLGEPRLTLKEKDTYIPVEFLGKHPRFLHVNIAIITYLSPEEQASIPPASPLHSTIIANRARLPPRPLAHLTIPNDRIILGHFDIIT